MGVPRGQNINRNVSIVSSDSEAKNTIINLPEIKQVLEFNELIVEINNLETICDIRKLTNTVRELNNKLIDCHDNILKILIISEYING